MSCGGESPDLDASRNLILDEHRHLDLGGSRDFNLEWWRGKP